MHFDYDVSTLKASWGVYAIENRRSGRRYIGSTSLNMLNRWRGHWYDLDKGIHDNKALRWDWLFFGADSFRFLMLEPYTERECSQWERFERWARHREAVHILATPDRYNVTLPAATTLDGEAARRSATRMWNAFYGTDLVVYHGPPWKHPTLSTLGRRA